MFSDPCKEYEPCQDFGLNTTFKACEAFSATYFECLYSCVDAYYPIRGDPSNGCLSRYENQRLLRVFQFFLSIDPCYDYALCEEKGNATFERCEPFSDTSYQCHYLCHEGYYPIDSITSNGCLSKFTNIF